MLPECQGYCQYLDIYTLKDIKKWMLEREAINPFNIKPDIELIEKHKA